MRLLVAAGSADELPGLLDWLEWGTLSLDLTAIGAGGSIEAPLPPGTGIEASLPPGIEAPLSPGFQALLPPGRELPPEREAPVKTQTGSRGAAVWLRPPEPGCEVEPTLPTLSALGGGAVGGGGGGAPDLVRLVETMATQCHRVRLRRVCAQPLAFS